MIPSVDSYGYFKLHDRSYQKTKTPKFGGVLIFWMIDAVAGLEIPGWIHRGGGAAPMSDTRPHPGNKPPTNVSQEEENHTQITCTFGLVELMIM
jgi:hypothetical protein